VIQKHFPTPSSPSFENFLPPGAMALERKSIKKRGPASQQKPPA
jgi:hypothetical protein